MNHPRLVGLRTAGVLTLLRTCVPTALALLSEIRSRAVVTAAYACHVSVVKVPSSLEHDARGV